MELTHYGYSLKNIPRCSKDAYLKALITRTEDFLIRLRWKAFFFLLGPEPPDEEMKETYGFRSNKSPPVVNELVAFESDIYQLIASIKFRHAPSTFLDRLDSDAARIKSSTTALIPTDKTSQHYRIPIDEYQRLIESSITAEYRKAPAGTAEHIENKAASIAARLDLKGRMQRFETSQAFVLLKDHKPNFATNLPCRLINPAKSDVGRVSKKILEKFTAQLRTSSSVNQWRSTGEVISWFETNCTPGHVQFLQFDIESFYPSISENLLDRALQFAQEHINISEEDIDTIKHSRLSLLFCPRGETWQRKDSLFDVTMGAPDGAEVCELVGVYLLSQIGDILPQQSHGLYRDDGLVMLTDTPGPRMERIRKDLFATFRREGLKITVSPPSTSVDFLDVTFRSDGSFRPFRKAEKVTKYVHRQSNHPPSIIRNIPEMIADRINSISSCKEVFDDAKPYYEDALKSSGYMDSCMTYNTQAGEAKPPRNRRRKRRVLWFNPPFSVTVETNVGRKFFNLLEKHFPQDNPLHKILNRNSVKVSYSCMKNMECLIKSRNKQLLRQHQETQEPTTRQCNCRSRNSCPLDGKCLSKSVVYMATLRTENEKHHYIGMTEGTFKDRYNGHTSSFRLERYRNRTKLSEKIWSFKDRGLEFRIEWKIIRRGHGYRAGQNSCDLCTSEKLEILLRSSDPHLLNSRTEILTKCRHKRKFLL
ncbi:uncharacterized protein LOC134824333 [Bolinopsis microptera]|uniref:uncharacterized protein LOC134824333 n=1 Tax=Bolinopsis microptera TaxID=2820187 RepID=UPI00307AE080